MSTSKAELEGLRARAQALQTEWRSTRAAAPESRLEAEREVEAEALRREIVHLEGVVVQEVKSAGGSVEDALLAMQRAVEVEKNVVAAHTTEEDEVDPREENGTDTPVFTSSDRSAGPSLPSNPPITPVDSGESSSPHLDVVDNPNSEMALEGHDEDEVDDEKEEGVSR